MRRRQQGGARWSLGVVGGVIAALTLGCEAPSVVDGARDPFDHVDPFIGTGGHGHTYPGATLPFGMVQLSPDTRLTGWDGCSGYHFTDDVVYGFSHTHLSGTGVSDYGDILLMPMVGTPTTINGAEAGPDQGYASRFDKANEDAEPGYYRVRLDEGPIEVELTATERTGVHRYTFPVGEPAHVIVDLVHRDPVTDASFEQVDEVTFQGWRHSSAWARDQRVWFVARFSHPVEGFRIDKVEADPEGGMLGDVIRGVLSFGELAEPLTVHVGLSSVDLDGARANLEAESVGLGFDDVRARARTAWEQALDRVVVEGGTAAQRTNFYTGLYHSLIAPNLASDVDGRYRGMDREIHTADGRRHYTVFSLWDTFRATHPLFTIIERERTREFIDTMLAMADEGGRLPVWELAGNETDTMIGYHAVPVIVDAWVKGIDDFDQPRALEAMVHDATLDRRGLGAYQRRGFIAGEDDAESVSKTLEYAYDDFCIARFAEGLGQQETAATFDRRAQGWRHLLDPETGFMRARRNQRWIEPFDPHRVDNNYTEANAWQYSYFVPQDTAGLIEALGGEEAFVARLDTLFAAESETTGRDQADITGLIGQYAHGNEPSHHMAWLYHHAGRPDRSAERVREILDTLYTPEPDGLSGNEDCGQMSSWYVLSAVGLYPITPCTPRYEVGAPLFDAVTFNLESGKSFTIATSGDGQYVESAALNGAPLTRSYLLHDEIMRGGELALTLSDQPSDTWGREAEPIAAPVGTAILAAPFVRSESDRFREATTVELVGPAGATLQVRRDDGAFAPYAGPITLERSTTLTFFAEAGDRRSPTVSSYLHQIPNDWTVTSAYEPNSQYTAGGAESLVDGLRGASNWRMGGWQGFQYSDFEAVVDLGEARSLRRVGGSFLQEQRSWIWMPKAVRVAVSMDGESFEEVATLTHDVPADADDVVLRDIVGRVNARARYVRITAENFGPIPRWHLGHGDNAFIFVDELLIE